MFMNTKTRLRKWYIRKIKKAVGLYDNYTVIVQLYDYLMTSTDDTETKLNKAKQILLNQTHRVMLRSIITKED